MSTNISKNDKERVNKWLDANFDYFCMCMDLLRENDPQKWEELYNQAVSLSVNYSPSKD